MRVRLSVVRFAVGIMRRVRSGARDHQRKARHIALAVAFGVRAERPHQIPMPPRVVSWPIEMFQCQPHDLHMATVGAADEQACRNGFTLRNTPWPQTPGCFVGEHLLRLIDEPDVSDETGVGESAVALQQRDHVAVVVLVRLEHRPARRINRRIWIGAAL